MDRIEQLEQEMEQFRQSSGTTAGPLLREVFAELRGKGYDLQRDEVPQGELMAALANACGDEQVAATVMKGARRGSRFAGPNADKDVVAHLAKGGSIDGPGSPFQTAAGPPAGVIGDKAGQSLAAGMKALAEGTGSAGGFLVERQVAADVLTLVRARSAVMRMLPTIVPVEKELALTSLSSGASASYVAENARTPVSEQTFAQAALLAPKELSALVPISKRLLRDADNNPSVEQVIRRDLAEVLALRQDLAFLLGDPANGEPRGIRNHAGLTPAPNLGANGATPTFDHLKDQVAALRAVNAPFNRPGWIFNARLLSTLEKVKDGQGRYLAEAGLLTFDETGGGGTLLGFPFRTTGQIPLNLTRGSSTDATFIAFGSDWDEAWVGENLDLEIGVSTEGTYTPDGGTTWVSAVQSRQVLFLALSIHDFALRRPQCFTVMEGVRP